MAKTAKRTLTNKQRQMIRQLRADLTRYNGIIRGLIHQIASDLDLSRQDLSGLDLSYIDFGPRANLSGVTMSRKTQLRGADLAYANMADSMLSSVDLDDVFLKGSTLDSEVWTKPLFKLWDEACGEKRTKLVKALKSKKALRGEWIDGPRMCPEAYLLGEEGVGDDFTEAWDTEGVSFEQVLAELQEHDPDFFAESK